MFHSRGWLIVVIIIAGVVVVVVVAVVIAGVDGGNCYQCQGNKAPKHDSIRCRERK